MGKSIATHLDEESLQLLKDVSAAENRPISQIVSVPLRLSLRMSPAVRRALFAIDGASNEVEKAFASKVIGRSILKAYDGILDAKYLNVKRVESNSVLDTEEKIEAEATRMSMR